MDSQTFLTYTCRTLKVIPPIENNCIYLEKFIITTKFNGAPPETVAGGATIGYTTCAGVQEESFILGLEGVYDNTTGGYITEMSIQTCIEQDSIVGPTPVDPTDNWSYTVMPVYSPEISCDIPSSLCTSYRVTLPDTIMNYSVEYVNCSGNLVRIPLGQVISMDEGDGTNTYSVCVQSGSAAPIFIQNNQAVEIGYTWQAGGPCSF